MISGFNYFMAISFICRQVKIILSRADHSLIQYKKAKLAYSVSDIFLILLWIEPQFFQSALGSLCDFEVI